VRRRAAARGLAGTPARAGLTVRAAYLGHAAPSPGQVLDSLSPGPVVVLPLLLTAAYHSQADLPSVLRMASARRCGRLRIGYGDPLGPHPLLIAALERRLAEAGVMPGEGRGHGDSGISVVLAAAGSSDPAAAAAVAGLAERWRALRGWRDVVPAYASAAGPDLTTAVAALRDGGARRVVVASYLLAPGRFAAQIRHQALAAGATTVSDVLGAAPELADIVLDRYTAALTEFQKARRRIA
jgi:sirohydrochlorin ferrochelatase